MARLMCVATWLEPYPRRESGPWGRVLGVGVGGGAGGETVELRRHGAESAFAHARQFYASPAGSDGYKRFSNAWAASTDADCANDVFNASETHVFSSKPFVIAAFAYDCVVALAAAMYFAGENAEGSAVFEAFTNVSFEGATGTVAFEPNGDRLASTVRYAVDVWRKSGSELSATSVGSFTASSGYTSSDDSVTWPEDTYAPPDALCSAKDYEYALGLVPCPCAPLCLRPSLSLALPPSQARRVGLRGHATEGHLLVDGQQQLHHRSGAGA